MAKDTIIIVRHGKPALSRQLWLTWRGFEQWWADYDAGGLAETQRIPKKLQNLANRADIVLSSPLPRAVESALLLTGRPADIIDPELVEAPLPPPPLGPLKLKPKAWGTLARILWYFGWSGGKESHRQARARADHMAAKLDSYAENGQMVLVTAHGWFNRMLKGSLMKQGWKCVRQKGDLHWSYRRFERKSQIERAARGDTAHIVKR